jgi:hypothetical protein
MRMFRPLAIALLIGTFGCGDDGGSVIDAPPGGNDDSGQGTIDAPPGQIDGAVVDARPPADALQSTCTPVNGTNITSVTVASGLDDPLFLTAPGGDPRLFIIEQPGRIRIVENGNLLSTPFLDISPTGANPRVRDTGDEQGLLGLAFHPDYSTNGRFFVNYIASSPSGETVIAEYTVSGNANVANTAETRIKVIDQSSSNHNGGMVVFGPDGYLYIGMGDGGSQNDPNEVGQDNTELLGAMLRIDVDSGSPYAIPASNPYSDSQDGANDPRPEIMHIGFRNPWRFSFDRQTGDMYVGDVGQDTREEISVYAANDPPGANFGWDVLEGSFCHEPGPPCATIEAMSVPAAVEHVHGSGVCSITGGYVYRGSCMPDVQGWYIYTDYCDTTLRKFEWSNGNVSNHTTISGNYGQWITSFGQDATGELYIINRGGTVRRLVTQ